MKICPECNKRPLKNSSCYTCVACVSVRLNRLKREKYKREKYKKDHPPTYIPEEQCIECKNHFTPYAHSYGLCSKTCLEKNKVRKANKEWANKVYDDKPKPRKDDAKVAYSFFRKKYGVKNKYKVCRG